MEFHLPGQIRTFRDVFVHLRIITLGILIALGLEQLLEAHHRMKIGRDAVTGFRHELTENREQLRAVMAATPNLRAQIAAQVAAISALRESDKTSLTIVYPQNYFDFISSASWDTAIANQNFYYIPGRRGEGLQRRLRHIPPVLGRGARDSRPGRTCADSAGTRRRSPPSSAAPHRVAATLRELYLRDCTVAKGALEACDRALQ